MSRRPTSRRIGALGRLAAASLLLAGCAGQPKDDPLVGGPPLPSNPAKPAAPATASATTTPDPRTGTPASTPRTTTSPAALAGAPTTPTGDPLLGAPDPRIHSTAPDAHGPGGSPGATLHDPIETTGAFSSPPGPGVTRAVAPPPRADDSYQQAQNLLASLGVTEQVLEKVGDEHEWHFLCKVPDPKKPGSKLVFEGTAPGEFGLAVIRAVLRKMEDSPELNGGR